MEETKNRGKLGFGLMRLPKIGEEFDDEQICRMVDAFLAAGYTYFDTAFVYLGSEEATKRCLVDRYPRDAYTLASKVNVGVVKTAEEAKQQLEISLQRTGAGYFDYYLLHALMPDRYKKFEEYGLWDYIKEKKAEGVIRHIGFSFHATPEILEEVLSAHPEVEFVQLQINYADWENEHIQARKNYEIVRKYGKKVVIMEPVKGGRLADPDEAVKALFDAVNPDATYASWALRFAAGLDGLLAVLSGMSTIEQMEDNLKTMTDLKPFNEAEQEAIDKAMDFYAHPVTIPCTACRYCTDGCPMQINIPEIFKAYNIVLSGGAMWEAGPAYKRATKESGKASDCIGCGQCESMCPQQIPIIETLAKIAEKLEKR
ncbi:MAG: aldo/keto reductase [Lachnospiraceae bacterium]|nr:aldo/keto reductase [Lachnospiraceae bacterium]